MTVHPIRTMIEYIYAMNSKVDPITLANHIRCDGPQPVSYNPTVGNIDSVNTAAVALRIRIFVNG